MDREDQGNGRSMITLDSVCLSRKCRVRDRQHLKHNITRTDNITCLSSFQIINLFDEYGTKTHTEGSKCAICATPLILTDKDSNFCNPCLFEEFSHVYNPITPLPSYTTDDIRFMREAGLNPDEGDIYNLSCTCNKCWTWRQLKLNFVDPEILATYFPNISFYDEHGLLCKRVSEEHVNPGVSVCKECDLPIEFPVHINSDAFATYLSNVDEFFETFQDNF